MGLSVRGEGFARRAAEFAEVGGDSAHQANEETKLDLALISNPVQEIGRRAEDKT